MASSRPLRLVVLCALALAALLLVACSAAQIPATKTPGEQSGAAPESATEAQPAAEAQPAPGEEALHFSKQKVAGDEIAVVTTNRGIIKFRMFAKDAPNTVASFIELANAKFYDGTKWHRVVPGFVVQGGDPLSRTLPAGDQRLGTGGPGWRLAREFGKKQADGTVVPAHQHLTGSVAMARSQDLDSAGSQFYICLAPQPSLDGQYTVFGQVTAGLDVLPQLSQGDSITSIRIEHGK